MRLLYSNVTAHRFVDVVVTFINMHMDLIG